jgi:hypothetical protein
MIFFSITIMLAIGLIVLRLSLARKKNEEHVNNIYTEIRKRAAGLESSPSLAKYSNSELEMIKEELRNAAYKKALGHTLLPQEKALINRFPNTYSIVKRSVKNRR